MCSVAAIPFALIGAQGLLGASSAQQAGAAQASADRQNASYSDIAAKDSIRRGATEEDQQRLQTIGAIGTQRAGFAANGVDVNSGTAANIQDDTAQLGEFDALTIRNNAAKEAWGYRTQSQTFRQSAKTAEKSATSNMFGSLLGAGASAGSAYFKLGR
jgi:hypothetical protein